MKYKWLVLSNTTVATLMASIDSNIVLISLPTIGRELPGTTATTLLWILLGYSLLTAVLLLNFGRLSDMFGRVRLYILGFAVFTIGSLLCGLSQTGTELVGFRLVQAVGAGFLFSNSAAIITDAFPPNERGRALGINQVSIVVGAVSGLVLGGIITTTLDWRWIFFVNVPIGVIATLRARADLKELASPEDQHHIDWLGNLLFALGLTLILLAVTLGALGDLDLAGSVTFLVVGFAGLAAFVLVEAKVRFPMLDLSLFRIRIFASTTTAILLNQLARGAFVFVLVFYLQGPPRYLSPFTAGLYLIPVSAALATAGPLAGWLSDRYGPRWFAIGGVLVAAAGFLWLSTIGPSESFLELTPPLLLVGTGMGLFASPNRATMMTSVPPERRGVASGVGTTFLNTGATVSLGITLLIMSAVVPRSALETILTGGSLHGGSAVFAAGFLTSIHTIFLVSAAVILCSLIPLFLQGRPKPAPIEAPSAEGD